MVGFELIGTGLDADEDEKPGSMSLAQRIAPSLAEFERGRDVVTGKRRFEGAFRGGWEQQRGWMAIDEEQGGWRPSEFRSSRNQRAEVQTTRLEDIVDEEDLRSLGSKEQASTQGATAAEVLVVPGAIGNKKGYELLRGMGWKTGSAAVGEEAEEPVAAEPRRQIGPMLPPGFRSSGGNESPPAGQGIGRFLEDVAKNKNDQRGVGSVGTSLGDSKIRPQPSGPIRRREYSDDEGDDVYNSIADPRDEEDEDPVIVRNAVPSANLSNDRPDDDAAVAHPFVKGFSIGDRMEVETEVSAESDDEAEFGPNFKHDFEADKFRRDLALPEVLVKEAVRVQNSEHRRLLLGEKALAKTKPPEEKESADQAEEQKQKILSALGPGVSSRFVSAGKSNVEGPQIPPPPPPPPKDTYPEGLATGHSARGERYFQPTNLLCKRFNVPHPEISAAKIFSTLNPKSMRVSRLGTVSALLPSAPQSREEEKPTEQDNEDATAALEGPLDPSEKPSTELFQAIFGDSDSDEDED